MALLSPETAPRLEQIAEIEFSPWDLVMAVAWSPDGELLGVSAGENLYLFQGDSQEKVFEVHIGAFAHSLAFSPDGTWLASGSRDGLLRVWNVSAALDAGSGDPDLTLEAHKKGVNSVAFSPSGRLLASGGNDAVARFWEVAEGELVWTAIGGTFAVPSIAFAPDGMNLAVVNGDVVRLRDVDSESIMGTFLADTALYSLAYSTSGDLLAVGGSDNIIRLWDPAEAFRSGQEQYPQPVELLGHTGLPGSFRALIWQVIFNPDGSLLASAGGDGMIRVWDVERGVLLASLDAHQGGAASVAMRPDERVLVSGGLDGVVRLWGVRE